VVDGEKAAEAAAWRCLSFYALCFNTLPQHNAAKSAKTTTATKKAAEKTNASFMSAQQP